MHTDPIADYLTRIRNAIRAGHDDVTIPASKVKMQLSRILKEQGLVPPAKKPPARPDEQSGRPRSTVLQARITQLLNEDPEFSVDRIKAQLGRDGEFVSPESIAELRANVMYCRRLLKEQGLLPPGKK